MIKNVLKDRLKINNISHYYSRRKLFVTFLILIAALTIDVSISNVTPPVTIWGIVTFTVIAGIFLGAQFFILNIIKAKNNESKYHLHQLNMSSKLDKIVAIAQYVLAAIMVFVLLQMLAISQYYTDLLTLAVAVSYGLAAFLLGLLAYRLFSWYRINKSIVILIYGLAYCIVVVNAIDSLVLFDTILLDKPTATVLPQSINL